MTVAMRTGGAAVLRPYTTVHGAIAKLLQIPFGQHLKTPASEGGRYNGNYDTSGLEPAGQERACGHDGGVPFGAGVNHADFYLQKVADKAEIVDGRFRQLRSVFHAVGRLAPAGQRFVFR